MITQRQRKALRRAAENACAQDHAAFDRLAHLEAVIDLLNKADQLDDAREAIQRLRHSLADFVGDSREARCAKGEWSVWGD